MGGPQKMHLAELQQNASDLTDLSKEHPNDNRNRRPGGGYGSSDSFNRSRREDSRGYRSDMVPDESDSTSNWRSQPRQVVGMSTSSMRSGGSMGSSRPVRELRTAQNSRDDVEQWRTAAPQLPPAPTTSSGNKSRFAFLRKENLDDDKPLPTMTNAQEPASAESLPSGGGILNRAGSAAAVAKPLKSREELPPVPERTSVKEPALPLKPEQPVTRLERTTAVSGPIEPAPKQAPLKPKKTLDTLISRQPGSTSAPAPYRPKSVASTQETPTPEPPADKKRRKPNEKKAALAASRAAVAQNQSHQNNLGKGSRNQVMQVVDKLEVIFDEDSSLSPAQIVDSIEKTVQEDSVSFNATLVTSCALALCVREVLHHAEGTDEQGVPADAAGVALDELVDTKLIPEAKESYQKVVPVLEEVKARCAETENYGSLLIRELMRICATSGCPSRLSPSITLSELMLIAAMQTRNGLVTPSTVLAWESDFEDETEGRGSALVQTANLVKWLKGESVAPESGDENVSGDEKDGILSDNE
eukprot:Protomagalhaensia_sp_Gyna_25__1070@NODE_151_length_4811_cov_152_372800_g117_i0_p1_GENE_NODE_151_length_4811_cov_152_372800_g117_i0NODE_151_length_4811_cov_152_372800_g117_i0_p1_ORF_typecomplete_len529_score106_73_NODE_151_length_4811_cov_152_372800_g117_i08812467